MSKEERLAKHSASDYLQMIADLYQRLDTGPPRHSPQVLIENVQTGYAEGLVSHEMLDELAVALHEKLQAMPVRRFVSPV